MSATHDHALVGDFLRYEYVHHVKDATDLARRLDVGRTTVYRLFDGDPRIKAGTYRRVEMLFELPEYALDHVRAHDLDELAVDGLPERPMRWLRRHVESGQAPGKQSGRTRNHGAG